MPILMFLDALLVVVGASYFIYQIFLMLVGLIKKPVVFEDANPSEIAIIICARNEEKVIKNLLISIKNQNYDLNKLDVWVIADNCQDKTAEIARESGAYVLERFDLSRIGKSYLLEYYVSELNKRKILQKYDAFIVMDADNIMDCNFVKQLNNSYCAGYKIVTGFRNSRNLNYNWIASGSSLWFLRESRMFSGAKMILGITSHVGGTGYLMSREILEDSSNWLYHTMTEDLELTMSTILRGEIVAYNAQAVFYDEQPTTLRQSFRQRVRWIKGTLQVSRYYSLKMFKQAVREKRLSLLDMGFFLFPWVILIFVRIFIGLVFSVLGFVSWQGQIDSFGLVIFGYAQGILLMIIMTIVTVFAEHNQIEATNIQLVFYILMFPLYCFAYLPVAIVAMFSKPQWKPIYHGAVK